MKKLILLILLYSPIFVFSQQVVPIEEYLQFNGRYDFTAFGNTLNTEENGTFGPCTITTESSADFQLDPGQTFVSAHLYWAGSGSGDFDVKLNGTDVTSERDFALLATTGLNYFSAYADVTNIINQNGQGTYTLSELDLTGDIFPYCDRGTNFGGWAIIIIYEDPSLLLNQITLFDGLDYVDSMNNNINITLDNISAATDVAAKIGFLAWEGDAGIDINESLRLNGILIDNPPLNPGNNAFNGTNSYTNSFDLYNMDLDFYDLQGLDIIEPGDDEIDIQLSSGQDFIMVNNIVVSVNSELPDATITIDNLGVLCEDRSMEVNYTVANANSTALLQANVPIAFYVDNVLVGQTFTVNEIPIDGTESGTINVNIPGGTPQLFTLKAVVDDDGTGNSTVLETNEDNNEFEQDVDLSEQGLLVLGNEQSCEGVTETLRANLGSLEVYNWFLNGDPYGGNTPTIEVTQSGDYSVSGNLGSCFVEESPVFTIVFDAPPTINETPAPLITCDPDSNGFTEFYLHTADEDITGGDITLTVTYHYTLLDAQTNEGILPEPFENIIPYNDTVYARVSSANTGCYAIVALELQVRDSPVLTEPTPYRLCDDDTDGYAIFDLTTKEDEILGGLDPEEYELYFYSVEQDAIDAGEAALNNPDFSGAIGNTTAYQNQVPNQQTLYVLGVGTEASTTPNNGTTGCYDIVELELIVDPLPEVFEPAEYKLCDDTLNGSTPDDQISTFDLTTRDAEITGGAPGVLVTWFETLADEAADSPIADPTAYQNTANGQTIVARATNGFECKALVTLTLVVEPLPTPAQPDALELCDQGNGFAEFDLSQRTVQITNGEPDVVIKYYPTQAEAEAGGPGEIPAPFLYTNTVPFNDSVWARVEKDITGCYALVELQLIVIPLPDAPDANFLDPYLVCDLDGDGQAIFDLTVQDASVYGVQDPVDFAPITYYIDLADAEAGTNAIDPANAFPSAGQTVYVRLESLGTGCFRITPFDLEVGGFPTHGNANDLVKCDDQENGSTNDDGISTFDLTENTLPIQDGDPSLSVYYYASEDDLDNDIRIVNPTAYQNEATPQQEIFVSITGQNTCADSISFFLIVNPNPQPVTPTVLYGCDVDNNGITYFDLDSKTAEIQGGDPSLLISYHETRLDATTGNYPLASPYENILLFNQTLFVRAAYDGPPAGTGCYTIVELELEVIPSPEIPQDLPDLTACEDSGFYQFDLTEQEDLIYGEQPREDYDLSYHLTEADAIAGENAIADPEAYTNVANPQTIWVRLGNNETECFKVGSFDLVVSNGLPIVDPEPLVKCDDLGEPFDETTAFDLTEKNAEITDGVLTQGVTYFVTQEDAQNNENPIDPDTAYENITNPQILYVRVEDSNSECIAYTTLTLKVVSNPEPITPDPIELCDVNVIIPPGPYDETELFDLTIREDQIRNGNTNWELGYYEGYDQAINEEDEIVAPEVTAYQNTSNSQIIYVRVTNPDSKCFEIVELELIVNPLPDASAEVSDYIICAPDDSEIGIFDLETKVPEILGQQTDPPFQVSFYLDQDDAENQTNALVNTTTHQNKDANNAPINPQTIYVGILNTDTGCYIGGGQSFELIVQRGAIAVAPTEPFVICDNLGPIDGYAEFDLDDVTDQQVSELRAGILGGQDPAVYGITFHETLEQAELGINAITFPFVNTINPQRIYVRVTNNDNQYEPKCYAVVELILKVEQLPEIFLDGEYRLCVDENGNPIASETGGMSPPIIDTGLDPTRFEFVWELDGVIIPGATGPSIIALAGGVYTVTYTEIASGCSHSVSATVTVSSPPQTYEATVVSGAFSGNHTIEVTTTGEGTYEYQLDDGPFQASPIFENVDPGTHTITIRDIYGCGSVTLEVSVIDYPPFFTPNEDGYHDTWNIIGIGAFDPQAKIYIFDRFGKLLKQLSPLGPGWNGNYNGNPLPSSDYWFRVEYTEDGQAKEFKGHFTLKR